MRLLDAVARKSNPPSEQRYTLSDVAGWVSDGSHRFLPSGVTGSKPDDIDTDFVSMIHNVHNRHGIVAAAVETRALLMSQVRFQWRRPDGSSSGSAALLPLERPGSTTRPALLSMLEHDVSYSGTAVVARRRGELFRLSPDRVRFVLGSNSDPVWDQDVMMPPFDAKVIGVTYDRSRGKHSAPESGDLEFFAAGEFAAWSPEPDPVNWWRGTSWVSSVMREVLLDGQVTDHEGKFFEHAATPSLVFMMDPARTPADVKAYRDIIAENHQGTRNAYKNMFLGGATDVKVVGTSLESLGLGHLQGTYENRVAVRSRIPAVVLGTKESLSGSSLNSGNYQAARRLLADGWFSPTVDGLCAALEPLVGSQTDGSELSHDSTRVLFLQEDQKDAADILQTNAVALRQLVEAGFDPTSAIAAVSTGDITKLSHTGNVSVQLQPPGNSQELSSATVDAEARADRAEQQQLPLFTVHNHIPEGRDVVVPAAQVTVEPTPVTVENVVSVPEQRAGDVIVSPTPVIVENTNQIDVSPTPVTVENNNRVDVAPAKVPPAQVTVVPNDDPATFKVRRDRDGRISEVVED